MRLVSSSAFPTASVPQCLAPYFACVETWRAKPCPDMSLRLYEVQDFLPCNTLQSSCRLTYLLPVAPTNITLNDGMECHQRRLFRVPNDGEKQPQVTSFHYRVRDRYGTNGTNQDSNHDLAGKVTVECEPDPYVRIYLSKDHASAGLEQFQARKTVPSFFSRKSQFSHGNECHGDFSKGGTTFGCASNHSSGDCHTS